MKLTGHDAIDFAKTVKNALLSKYADPLEGERDDLSLEEAIEIAKEDPEIIFIEVENPSPDDVVAYGAGK